MMQDKMFPILLAALAFNLAPKDDTAASPVTFERDVLPILQKHCQSCHRPGQVAPMSFLSYQSTRPWAKAIKEAVLSRKMPPWPADPRFGRFLNDPTLTQSQIDTLVTWADNGAPEGDPKDKPTPVSWRDGWSIRPDVVVSLPHPIAIPARGVVELTDVTIPNCFQRDTWVTAIEIRPGNRSVVHHADLFLVRRKRGTKYGVPRAEEKDRDAQGVAIEKVESDDRLRGLDGQAAIYVPGTKPVDYSRYESAKLIPAGSDFVIQMHYTPNGTATTDQTRVAFTLAKGKPRYRFLTIIPTALRDKDHFHIPAGDPNWETHTEVVFKHDAQLVWFLPHMHLRGKDMTYRLLSPGGEPQTLLSVKYDFDWQLGYELAKPIMVPKGARISATAHYDNSSNNRFNPDPNRDVWWGDQTWEEMMISFFGVIVSPDLDVRNVVAYRREFSEAAPR